MSRPRGRVASLALVAALGTTACASSSIGTDVSRVRDLTRIEELAQVTDVEVDPAVAEDARQLLTEPLGVETAVRVAMLNNRELRAMLRELGIARGQLVQAGLLPNPVVEAELLPERNTRFELRVEYNVTRALLAPRRARAAEPDLEAARYRAAVAVLDLGYQVRVAFYRLQAAEQGLTLSRQVLDGYAASREAARAMGEAGNVAEIHVASQEAAYERSRVMVAQLELDVATERERVQRLLGTHGTDTAWQVNGELPPVPEQPTIPEDMETRVLRASLDLMEMKQRLEGLSRKTGVTRVAGLLPDVVVDVHGLQGNPAVPIGAPGADQDWLIGAGVSVELPLFDRRQGTVTALEAEFDALMERYYGAAVDLRSEAREARNRVLSSHARARQYQEVIVPAQRRVTEQTLLQYNAMQLGIFELLQALREQLAAELDQVETLREYWSSTAEIDALLAGRRVSLHGRSASRPTMGAPEWATGRH